MQNLPKSFVRAVFLVLLASASFSAEALFLDFEGYPDGLELIPGGTVLTAGVSLNEFDYPPTSGVNVLAALSGEITFNFAQPVDYVSGYFTSSSPLHFTGLDSSGSTVFEDTPMIFPNLGSADFLEYSTAAIFALKIASSDGSGFTMDDTTAIGSIRSVPEPSSLLLVISSAMLPALRRSRPPPLTGSSGRHAFC